jgi:hypothetical protein
MSCASSGHITKLKQSIFAPFNIYGRPPEWRHFLFTSGVTTYLSTNIEADLDIQIKMPILH